MARSRGRFTLRLVMAAMALSMLRMAAIAEATEAPTGHEPSTTDPTTVLTAPWPSTTETEAPAAGTTPHRTGRWIPAVEIIGFDLGVNRAGAAFSGEGDTYAVTLESIRHNLTHGWVVDNDPFDVNQFLHPYQGSTYHGFARSAGFGYWKSCAYTFAGSLLWEIAGETTPPAKNDQIASGIAGSFFGEARFRMASLILEREGGSRFWRKVGATLTDPPVMFNRAVFGDRFDAVFPSRGPAYASRLMAGGSLTALTDKGLSASFVRNEAVVDELMEYGLPGKAGYVHERPFDYFSFQFTASSANLLENVLTRGLLVGQDYAAGDRVRGIWGIYGSYDYIAPQIFRISSTAGSVGTTAQAWLSRSVALQGSALLGIGYGAAGSIHGTSDKDYHYGLTPQGLVALKLIFGDRASLDVTARDYYVTRWLSGGADGWENVTRADTTFVLRVRGRHGVAVRYTDSRRHSDYPDQGDRSQSRGTVSVYYTLLGGGRLGAVTWPSGEETGSTIQ